MKKIKHKIYRTSDESWFYKKFIKGTINDNFITPKEVFEKKENQEILQKVKDLSINSNNK